MTVLGELSVTYRRYSGYAAPALPEGYWLGVVTVVGDASGGALVLTHLFSLGSPKLNSRIFSLDQYSIFSLNEAANRGVAISTLNMGIDGPSAIINRWDLTLDANGASTTSSPDTNAQNVLPMFLGAMRFPSIQLRLTATMANPGAGVTYQFEAQGYWWGPRAVLVDGGPQRPATGLYRN